MLRNRFSKRSNGDQDDKQFSCTIRFLDDSEPLSFTYQKDTKGQEMFDQVCHCLDLLERDCFGLRFVDSEKQRHWLDLLKPVYRQLKHVHPAVLCFRVKFYPSDPVKLKEEITRYFLFLQLRRDLHHGRLLCSQQDANLLAAYIIQSEVGDYDPEEHLVDYVGKFKMLPKQSHRQEEKITELHKSLAGQTPADAEANFLQKAAILDTYGVDPHPVKDPNGNQLYLGVTHLGIVTFQGSKRTRIFAWAQINKITFEGKMFILHVTITEKKHMFGYKCPTLAACKHLWKCAVEQRYFFTLESSKDVPKVTSSGGIFSRGSRFRFSGRCEKETYRDNTIDRDEPRFIRTSSNPQFAQRYSSLRSGSVPATFNALGLSEESLDSLNNYRQGQWRSLDDFSRTSTPRRPMELADNMIPEESCIDSIDNCYAMHTSASKGDLPLSHNKMYDSSDNLPVQHHNGEKISNGNELSSRRRHLISQSRVQDNNIINAQLQELQSSHAPRSIDASTSPVSEAPLGNGDIISAAVTTPGMISQASPHRSFILWILVLVVCLGGTLVFIIFSLDRSSDLHGSEYPDIQEIHLDM